MAHLIGLEVHVVISNLEVYAYEVDEWYVIPNHGASVNATEWG